MMSCSEWLLSQKRRERARTVSVSAQTDYDQIYTRGFLAATPTENETCGHFGGMIAVISDIEMVLMVNIIGLRIFTS
jgi:hypothetical protein